MRIANLAGRLVLIVGNGAVDVAEASGGRFSYDPQQIYERFDEFRQFATSMSLTSGRPFQMADLGPPVPAPRQVFAVGLNYKVHAEESGFELPSAPTVFTKFVSSISPPYGTVELPDGNVDWEVELVAVVGKRAFQVHTEDAWDYVAGLTGGQDLSERKMQLAGTAPQFSLAKSYPGFAPLGPVLVTIDEFADPDDLQLVSTLNGEPMQRGRTSDLIYSVPALVAYLSSVLPLLPGDVIFTGTPPGVGMGRRPQHFIGVGDALSSSIEGIGELRQVFVRQSAWNNASRLSGDSSPRIAGHRPERA